MHENDDDIDERAIGRIAEQGQLSEINLPIAVRKKTEDAIRSRAEFASALLDTMEALVVVLDAQGGIVSFNRACQQATGYSLEEVRGKPVWDMLLVPEEVETVLGEFSDLLAGDYPAGTRATG